MDPDAINNAASPGPKDSGAPACTPAQQVLAFLRTEALYLAVVALVVVMGGMKTIRELRAQQEQLRTGHVQESAGPAPLLQKDLDANAKALLAEARNRSEDAPRHAAAFAEGVELLTGDPRSSGAYLFWGGAVVALVLALAWALRSRHAVLPVAAAPPWGLWDVLKLAALWAVGARVLHMRPFFPLNPERPFAAPGDWIAEIFTAILLVGVMIHIVIGERGGRLRDLGLRGKFFGGLGIGLTAFLVIQPFLRLVAVLEQRAVQNGLIPEIPLQQAVQVILQTRSGAVLALAVIVAVVVAPISEELLFRGFLQPALGRWTGRWLGIVLSGAFFAAAHMDLYAMPPLLVLGIALGYVYDRTQSLAAPVALHMIFNGMTLLSVFAFRGLVTALSATH